MITYNNGYRLTPGVIENVVAPLITHRPPYGVLDFEENNNFGCLDLLQSVQKIRPKYHLFGHIHTGYGIEKSRHTTFVNASLVRKSKIENEPFLLEI